MKPKTKKSYIDTHNFVFNTLIVGERESFAVDLVILTTYTEQWVKQHKAQKWWEICKQNPFIFLAYCVAEDVVIFLKISKKFENIHESLMPPMSQEEIIRIMHKLYPQTTRIKDKNLRRQEKLNMAKA